MKKTFGIVFLLLAAFLALIVAMVFIQLVIRINELNHESSTGLFGLITGYLLGFILLLSPSGVLTFFGIKWIKQSRKPLQNPATFQSEWGQTNADS